MKEKIPVNPEILRWARTSIGFSIDEAAAKIGKESKIIENWESGESTPTYPQLEKLAYSVYKRPIAVFFFPSVPMEENLKTEFRTIPDTIIDSLPPEIIKMYRKAKVFQLNLSELYENQKPLQKNLLDLFYVDDTRKINQISSEIRLQLGVDIQTQFGWKSYETAFKFWRNQLENNGIFVFKDAFHNDDYSGFCIYDTKYPIIFINNSMSQSRQIFTLFHELAHLLMRAGGIDFHDETVPSNYPKKYSLIEVMSNNFANEILVPSSEFEKINFNINEKKIEELSQLFCVSREVILRNLLQRNKITEKTYSQLVNKWFEAYINSQKKTGGGNYHLTQKVYLGETYIKEVFTKYYQNKISVDRLSDYLGIKVKSIGTFEYYAMGAL